MIQILNKADCTGCGACRDICPTGAICLCADEEGFLYPQVDQRKCVACGRCDKSCPVTGEKKEIENKSVTAYAAQSKDQKIRSSSSSGGVFSEIANRIFDQKGVVFGAAFDEKLKVRHIAVESPEQLGQLRGSKYVQSEIGDSYVKAKAYLDAGRTVLFTGTPCQIGGLLAYLKRDYPNLFTQDIICHGVPSPMIWEKYLRCLEGEEKVCSVSFRDKRSGWKSFSMRVTFDNGRECARVLHEDPYMKAFSNNLCLRPSCYQCAFKTKNRAADLTLADFWGIENVEPELDDNKGTSLVLIHSEKGKALFEAVQERLKWQKTDADAGIRYNSAMTTSVPYNKDRDAFVSAVAQEGFGAAKKFVHTPVVQKIKRRVKRMVKKVIRRK